MSHQKFVINIILAALLLGLGGSALAEAELDPIIRMDSTSKMEIDLGMMIDDLMPTLMEILEAEDEESLALFNMLMEQVGIDAMQILKMEVKQNKYQSTSKMTVTLDSEKSETLVHRLFSTPNGECGFGEYLNRDDLVMFMTLHNFASYLDVFFDFMAKPEMSEFFGEIPTDANGDFVFGEFNPRRDLLPLLAGELDFFVLETPEGPVGTPLGIPYTMVLGSTDGFALKEKILELATTLGGEMGGGMASMIASIEPVEVGGFEFSSLPMGGALAVNENYLVISMSPDFLKEALAAKKGDLKAPNGIEWIYMDGSKYGAYMELVMDMAAGMSQESDYESELMMKFYSVLFDYIETEEVLVKSQSNSLMVTAKVDGPVMSGLYQMVKLMVEELPEMLEQQRLREEMERGLKEYQDAVGMFDEGMMAYAENNDGTYPEDPKVLFDEGYIDSFPLSARIPAGEFLDWGYTYHLLKDDKGSHVGYLLFVYGGDEKDGFDVYTPENLLDLENFRIGRDGSPDGVASFCYDGTAIEQVDEYFGSPVED